MCKDYIENLYLQKYDMEEGINEWSKQSNIWITNWKKYYDLSKGVSKGNREVSQYLCTIKNLCIWIQSAKKMESPLPQNSLKHKTSAKEHKYETKHDTCNKTYGWATCKGKI